MENTQDVQTAPEQTDSEESTNIVEDSEQEQPVAEQIPAEATDAGEVEVPEAPDGGQAEHVVEEGKVEESGQEQPAVEQIPAEATDAGQDENVVEEGKVEDSEQEQPVAEQMAPEATGAGEVADQAGTEQVPQEMVDSENASAEQNNMRESQLLEPDESSDQEDTVQNSNASNVPDEETAVVTETSGESATGKIFEAIQKMTRSPSSVPDQSTTSKKIMPGADGKLFELSASDIMQTQVTWASPDESLQQALAKMKQTDAGYILVGRNGRLEGIVSKSDITRAMSPYLQPIFAKWRRPLDDATLKIRIKWIMSRPVHTIKSETSLAAIMEYMSQFRGRCLAVMDEQGNVHGLVTAFDIFQALLKWTPFCPNVTKSEPRNESNTYAEGENSQTLVESMAPAGTTQLPSGTN
jgi:CBS domain-containing protein